MATVERIPVGKTPEGHLRWECRVNHKLQGHILGIMEIDANSSRGAQFKHYVLEKDFQKGQAVPYQNEVEVMKACAKLNGRIISFDEKTRRWKVS